MEIMPVMKQVIGVAIAVVHCLVLLFFFFIIMRVVEGDIQALVPSRPRIAIAV
jgi:hypothetical protein